VCAGAHVIVWGALVSVCGFTRYCVRVRSLVCAGALVSVCVRVHSASKAVSQMAGYNGGDSLVVYLDTSRLQLWY
jgi:hypothetical protein